MERGEHLSDDQVLEIRKLLDDGKSRKSVAKAFNVSLKTISHHAGPIHGKVQSLGKEQTYRENINWAMTAAGSFLRTGEKPTVCPNDSAWFLYNQACDEPKDFLAKVGAVEKGAESAEDPEIKKSTRKTLAEIETFLEKLDEENQENTEEKTRSGIGYGV
jgi:hypothetical protein